MKIVVPSKVSFAKKATKMLKNSTFVCISSENKCI